MMEEYFATSDSDEDHQQILERETCRLQRWQLFSVQRTLCGGGQELYCNTVSGGRGAVLEQVT